MAPQSDHTPPGSGEPGSAGAAGARPAMPGWAASSRRVMEKSAHPPGSGSRCAGARAVRHSTAPPLRSPTRAAFDPPPLVHLSELQVRQSAEAPRPDRRPRRRTPRTSRDCADSLPSMPWPRSRASVHGVRDGARLPRRPPEGRGKAPVPCRRLGTGALACCPSTRTDLSNVQSAIGRTRRERAGPTPPAPPRPRCAPAPRSTPRRGPRRRGRRPRRRPPPGARRPPVTALRRGSGPRSRR
ncbi:MAG: hypothetical protein QOC78_3438 [Solirubrobacteraceae bacterium]|nr:hypothetical protein [Solirubrobacteraceae bacterium]